MRYPLLALLLLVEVVSGSPEAERLYDRLLSSYNRLIRPVGNNTDKLTVQLGFRLTQILDIDERNQIMTTNVWLKHQWQDYKLEWDPKHYNGVNVLYVPSELIWLPDIVLYNNADGDYQITLMTKATLYPNGTVMWEPPAIYKSFCEIKVEYFPYDNQTCKLKFGSWSYDGYEVDLVHETGQQEVNYGIDLSEYHISAEWDILAVPAIRHEVYYPCCPEPFPDVTFYLEIRRKTLFFTVNLIIPCIGISFLTVLVFYLPADSKQKVTLCITILQSITVFFLLLSEIIPETSFTVPLIGRYLLFTMILVTLSTVLTVIVIHIHRGGPQKNSSLSPIVRKIFMDFLPKVLFMRPLTLFPTISPDLLAMSDPVEEEIDPECDRDDVVPSTSSYVVHQGITYHGNQLQVPSLQAVGMRLSRLSEDSGDFSHRSSTPGEEASAFPPNISQALKGVAYIERHMRNIDRKRLLKEEWKYVAMVLDRLFLWVFSLACLGAMAIILQAPSLYDYTTPIEFRHP